MLTKLTIHDICGCYMSIFDSQDDINDYEEKLLEKCFDNNYENFEMGQTVSYAPPFLPDCNMT